MARPKAVETTEETTQSPSDALDLRIRAMIDAMSRNVSPDLNKHQIQASIYSRMETWAIKELKKPVNAFTEAGVESWDSILPKYVKHVVACSESRHARVLAFMERKKAEGNKRFADTLIQAIEARS